MELFLLTHGQQIIIITITSNIKNNPNNLPLTQDILHQHILFNEQLLLIYHVVRETDKIQPRVIFEDF